MAKSGKEQTKKQQFWGGRLQEAPEALNISYCAGRDVAGRPMADAVLVPYDVWQNKAHVSMLCREKIIKPALAARILTALDSYDKLIATGERCLCPEKEDVHTNIEHFVAETEGPNISGVMHSGRSRNDQCTTVVRMFLRDRVMEFGLSLCELISALLDFAEKNKRVPVGGYTHYQPASVTSVGHWFCSHAQALMRDVDRLLSCYDRINISPLGAAASFGTGWAINRELTARLMGFREVQVNSLDCVTNRWEMEADAGSAVSFAMTHLSILAQDIVMLSNPHIGVLRLADRFVTGSSIMPQKRNPDFCEVTRAKATLIEHLCGSLFGIARGVFSGYNRDTQWSKYVIMDLLDEAREAPAIFRGVVSSMSVDKDRSNELAQSNFINAVDIADALARKSGLPFRKTYEIVSVAVKLCDGKGSLDPKVVEELALKEASKHVKLSIGTPMQILESKKHTGAPSPKAVQEHIGVMREKLLEMRGQWQKNHNALDAARSDLEKLRKAFI
ncbi:argininosuccinate lyase [Candidatus Sumerlaeota bacterium]|nr:argininosuccinate lyase [Candidatus Sumerlaeota bacterium]